MSQGDGGVVRRPWRRRLGWLVFALVLGVIAGWSGKELLAPPQPLAASPEYAVVAAQEGSVGQSIRLNTAAEWIPEATIRGDLDGTVTEMLVADGETVDAGDRLLTVGLRPVVVAEGSVPTFRDLGLGARGQDVEQLQTMLTDLGYDVGQLDGRFGPTTRAAVQAWQGDIGVQPSGVVLLGDLVTVPDLPARVALAEELSVGARVVRGDALLTVLPDEPSFSIELPEGQAQLVEAGQEVTVRAPSGGDWSAVVGSVDAGAAEVAPSARLEPVDGSASICGQSCEEIPVQAATLVPSTVQVIPQVEGIVVPASAVVTTADGTTAVVLDDGSLRGVTVRSGAFGTVVLEGLRVGELVRAPALLPDESAEPRTHAP